MGATKARVLTSLSFVPLLAQSAVSAFPVSFFFFLPTTENLIPTFAVALL